MSDIDEIDRLCDQFEAAWQKGERPDLADFLAQADPADQESLLRELIGIDVAYRLKAGEIPDVASYGELHPEAIHIAWEIEQQQSNTTQTALPGSDARTLPLNGLNAGGPDPDATCPPSSILDQFQKAEKAGKHSPIIGPYKLLQRIGEGGMGSVFLAEQSEPVRRRVALKLIKAGMGSKEIITRFEAERQALAMMDHPNIARVYDAGTTPDGRPYFVMELVNGIPITQYCDKSKLSLNERLELFVQACRAIQHAHQKGIIHRDIKPSNVLVTQHDGVPVVKVIDFGLAKAMQSAGSLTDQTMFTQMGQVLGTLQYMSPEQAEMNALDVDTRSDVYSLGILLYELLTGSTPIEKSRLKELALDRLLAAIREEEPPRPSHRLCSLGESATNISEQRKTDPRRLGSILRGDLDWIAMKALEKDRTRRYDSPIQMAEDVQRYLSSEAILARPPSLKYRLQKTVRKHRVAVVTAISILGLLLIGSAATFTQMRWAEIEKKLKAREETVKAIALARAAREETDQRRIAERSLWVAIEEERYDAEVLRKQAIDLRRALERQKKLTDEIVSRMKIAIQEPPRLESIDEVIAVGLYRLGRFEETIETLEHLSNVAVSNSADSDPKLTNLALLAASHHQLGDTEEAQRLWKELLAAKKSAPDRTSIDAQRLVWEAAIILNHPPEPEFSNEVMEKLVMPQDIRKSIRGLLGHLSDVILTTPSTSDFEALAIDQYRLEKWKEVIATLDLSARVVDEDASVFFPSLTTLALRALSLRRLGKTDQAQRLWKELLQAIDSAPDKVSSNAQRLFWEAAMVFEHPPEVDLPIAALRGVYPGIGTSWSSDGRIIFNSSPRSPNDGHLIWKSLTDSESTPLFQSGKDPAGNPRRNSLIAYAVEGDIGIFDADTNQQRKIGKGEVPSWSADGKLLYFHDPGEKWIKSWNIDNPDAPPENLFPCRSHYYPAVSPDGTKVAFQFGRKLIVAEVSSEAKLFEHDIPNWSGLLLGWSPEGKYIAFGDYGNETNVGLWAMNTETGKTVKILDGNYTLPRWSHDGKYLSCDDRHNHVVELFVVEALALP